MPGKHKAAEAPWVHPYHWHRAISFADQRGRSRDRVGRTDESRIHIRGLDLNQRPLGYEPLVAPYRTQDATTQAPENQADAASHSVALRAPSAPLRGEKTESAVAATHDLRPDRMARSPGHGNGNGPAQESGGLWVRVDGR